MLRTIVIIVLAILLLGTVAALWWWKLSQKVMTYEDEAAKRMREQAERERDVTVIERPSKMLNDGPDSGRG